VRITSVFKCRPKICIVQSPNVQKHSRSSHFWVVVRGHLFCKRNLTPETPMDMLFQKVGNKLTHTAQQTKRAKASHLLWRQPEISNKENILPKVLLLGEKLSDSCKDYVVTYHTCFWHYKECLFFFKEVLFMLIALSA